MSIAYEGVILFGVVFFFGYAFSAVTRWQGHPGALRWAFQAYMFVVLGVYFGWFWSEGRRTLPMKTMALVLQCRDGAPVSRIRALGRYAIAGSWVAGWLGGAQAGSPWLGLAIFIPFFWPFLDRDRRALYDIASGTRLAFVPVSPALRRAGRLG